MTTHYQRWRTSYAQEMGLPTMPPTSAALLQRFQGQRCPIGDVLEHPKGRQWTSLLQEQYPHCAALHTPVGQEAHCAGCLYQVFGRAEAAGPSAPRRSIPRRLPLPTPVIKTNELNL